MAQTKAQARSEFFKSGLSVNVDPDGRLQIKCRPMFRRELARILRDISRLAREIVKAEHEKPRKVIVDRQVVTRPSSGKLRRSIHPGDISTRGPHRIVGSVSAGSRLAPYAKFVHEGTKRHRITARPGGYLSFYGAGRHGNKTFTKRRYRLMTDEELSAFSGGNKANAAERARANRRRLGARQGPLRSSQADVVFDEAETPYARRAVAVKSVNHPGYEGHRFLNQAAAIVVSRRYGGTVGFGSHTFRGLQH